MRIVVARSLEIITFNMLRILTHLLTLIIATTAHPIQVDETTTLLKADENLMTQNPIPLQLQREIDVLAYVENFKSAMTDYVRSQYHNLTVAETEQVKAVLEGFLRNFAKDLREAVDKQYIKTDHVSAAYEKIDDGIPDETFKDINERVRAEFPDINDDTAKDIVYRLRKNLFETRKKLDEIVFTSQVAQNQN